MKRNKGREQRVGFIIIAERKIRFRSKKTFVLVASPCYLAGLVDARVFNFISRVVSGSFHDGSMRKRFVNLPRGKKVWQKFLARINTDRNSADQFSIVSLSLS